MNNFKKIYFSLILSFALAYMIQYVLGFTSAVAIPKNIFEIFGSSFGLFMVGLVTVTFPYFLLAMLTMPALVFITGRKAPRYSFIMLIGVFIIGIVTSNGLEVLKSGVSFILPTLIGLLSIVLAATITTKYVRTI